MKDCWNGVTRNSEKKNVFQQSETHAGAREVFNFLAKFQGGGTYKGALIKKRVLHLSN